MLGGELSLSQALVIDGISDLMKFVDVLDCKAKPGQKEKLGRRDEVKAERLLEFATHLQMGLAGLLEVLPDSTDLSQMKQGWPGCPSLAVVALTQESREKPKTKHSVH